MFTVMKQFFMPTRRLQDMWEEHDIADPFEYTEVELAVPAEDFLSYHWDWKDLQALLIGGATPNILWITENAFLVVKDSGTFFDFDNDYSLNLCISAQIQVTSGLPHTLHLATISSGDIISTAEISVFWRAVLTSSVVELAMFSDWRRGLVGLPSGPALSKFLRESSSLQLLEFDGFSFNEEHCRALVTLERTDLELKLHRCPLAPQDAAGVFIEWFRHNEVVTEIDCCQMGSRIISALSGNNFVKKLKMDTHTSEFAGEEMRSLLQVLPGNMGIEDLSFHHFTIRGEPWNFLFRSLSTHPRIKLLSLSNIIMFDHAALKAESMTARMNAILQMLQRNTVLHTLELPDSFNNEEVYQNSILPRLQMNISFFEVQRLAVQRADPSIRPQLLGWALHVVQYNPELIFLFLSENVPAFVLTGEEDEDGDREEDCVASSKQDPVIVSVSGQKRKVSFDAASDTQC